MVTRTPPANYQKYFDSSRAPTRMESGRKEFNVKEKEKTDNNTARTNSDQPQYNTRYIQANHNALFGYQPKDGYILPGRTLNAERRNEFEKGKQEVTKSDHDKSGKVNNKLETGNTQKDGEIKPEDYSAVRHGVDRARERVENIDHKVNRLDSGARYIPQRLDEAATDMAAQGRQVDDLQMRNKAVSAKIHALERELKEVQLENRTIKGKLLGPGYDQGYDPIPEHQGPSDGYAPRYYDDPPPSDRNGYHGDIYTDQAKDRIVRGRDGAPNIVAKNAQFAHNHAGRIKDEKGNSYYGLNKLYDPNSLTSYRNEQVPYLQNRAERDKITQYQRDYETEYEKNKRKQAEYEERQREMESRYLRKNSSAGGLCLIRFHESTSPDINTAIHLLQRSLFSVGALVLGIAHSRSVALLEGSNGWRVSKREPPRPQLSQLRESSSVHDAVLAIWFPTREKASELFRSEANHNRFRGDPTFLNPYGYDTIYVPLNACPARHLDSFLVLEIPHAKWYDSQKLEKEQYQRIDSRNQRWYDLKNFEMESRDLIKGMCRSNTLPNFCDVTCTNNTSIDGLKPGTIFKQGSRVFISAFEYLADIAEVWGPLKDLLDAHKIQRDYQVFAFSVKDTKDEYNTPHWH